VLFRWIFIFDENPVGKVKVEFATGSEGSGFSPPQVAKNAPSEPSQPPEQGEGVLRGVSGATAEVLGPAWKVCSEGCFPWENTQASHLRRRGTQDRLPLYLHCPGTPPYIPACCTVLLYSMLVYGVYRAFSWAQEAKTPWVGGRRADGQGPAVRLHRVARTSAQR